jgi:hypothetical protein
MNGKGDSPRPVDLKRYRENYDLIFRKKPTNETDDDADKKREISTRNDGRRGKVNKRKALEHLSGDAKITQQGDK